MGFSQLAVSEQDFGGAGHESLCPLGCQRDCPEAPGEDAEELCWWLCSSLSSSANAANEGLKLRSGIWVCPEKHAAGNDV